MPQIIDQGVYNGKYIWKVKVPVNITYVGSNQPSVEQAALVNLTIIRTDDTGSGIAISEYYIFEKK